MRFLAVFPAALLLVALGAHGSESLWCRVKAGEVAGHTKAPKITDFYWSSEQGPDSAGPIKSSIGPIDQGQGPHDSTAITVNGKAVSLPPATLGIIRFGQVYDFGGRVAVVYAVETATDFSATPSEAIVLIGKGPKVLEHDLITNEQAVANGCPLL